MNKKAREVLLERLQVDLLGPSSSDESLKDRPSDRYLTGILSPRRLPVEQEQNDKLELDGDDENEESSSAVDSVSIATATRPASAGISFAVKSIDENPPGINIRISCGSYKKVEESSIGEDGSSFVWKRTDNNIELNGVQLNFTSNNIDLAEYGLNGLHLYIQRSPWQKMSLVTVAIVNTNEITNDDKRQEIEEKTFFQTCLEVRPDENSKLPARPTRHNVTDEDGKIAALIYRNTREFAVGHTCSAEWDAPSETYAEVIRTTWIPETLVKSTSSLGDEFFSKIYDSSDKNIFSASWLSETQGKVLTDGLNKFIGAYDKWISKQEAIIPSLNKELHEQAEKHMKICRKGLSRMKEAIGLIGSNKEVETAFRLSNRAMLIQRNWTYTDENDLVWRPFQLGFLLLSLPSVSVKDHPDRDTMDLLWFPTGGGKTEAYLALTAFTLFLRRIRNNGQISGGGVSVLMRYTLRLLTIQQFQRAAALIFACEYIRNGNEIPSGITADLGETPFSIGLWVGSGSVPNNFDDARNSLNNSSATSTPVQLTECPCCHKKLKWDVDENCRTIKASCSDSTCRLSQSHPVLPVWTVDEDVYREKPSLVIGTVDKFAQIVRKPDTGVLFGLTTPHDPPDLIIQDELHLISGPLGTMAACYEIAIDELCSRDGIRPKIIGSTATIRRAEQQIRNLFDRNTYQFPAPGLDADNSGFAVTDNKAPGRLYLGLTTAGRSAKFSLQAACASLLQSCATNELNDTERDPYWTLVTYFNSLRELGGALVLMEDDVGASVYEFARRYNEDPREIFSIRELTSRVSSSDIPEILSELKNTVSSGDAHDILLASNMISVGVDIPRLGLMVVNGQPKGIAEYIQSTSRVGRGNIPGLVLTLYNNGKTRDRSHFETFSTWHSTLYREVEATSVTPFASRARDKALHAVLIALVRHLIPILQTSPRLDDTKEAEIRKLFDIIIRRTTSIDPDEITGVQLFLNDLLSRWRARSDLRQYWNDRFSGTSLMMSAEEAAARRAAGRAETGALPTPNSLRTVEPGTAFVLVEKLKSSEVSENAAQ